MIRAVYPGNFDPVTNGHLNIIKRAAKLVDQLIIAIYINNDNLTEFNPEERREMVRANISDEIKVMCYDGLLIDFAKNIDANLIIKGLCSISDFEIEFQKSQMNKKMNKEIETIFLASELEYNYFNSALIKDACYSEEELKKFLPADVQKKFQHKQNRRVL